MARYLKRWESPRREGRNEKGKGGTARQRQLKKRHQMLRKKLQDGSDAGHQGGREHKSLPFFIALIIPYQPFSARDKT
jgi:hypothetical protein